MSILAVIEGFKEETAIPAVIPAEAGIQKKCNFNRFFNNKKNWIAASAGMTQSSEGIAEEEIKKDNQQKIDKKKFDKLSSALKQNLKRRKMPNQIEKKVINGGESETN